MKKNSEWLKNNKGSLWKGILIFITVGFGLAAEALNGSFKTVVDIGFYVAFAFELLVVMLDFNKIGKNVLEMQKKIKQEECIYFKNSAKAGEHQKAEQLIEETSAGSIYIICYGTQLYGHLINDAITNIKDYKKQIRINLIICSPHSSFLSGRENESNILCENVNFLLQNSSYFNSVYLLQKPKTYRACMIKNEKGKAIYASFQSYIISKSSFLSTQDSRTPIISACENNYDVLEKIEDFLDKEWKDIREQIDEQEFIKIIENGKPFYEGEFLQKPLEAIC